MVQGKNGQNRVNLAAVVPNVHVLNTTDDAMGATFTVDGIDRRCALGASLEAGGSAVVIFRRGEQVCAAYGQRVTWSDEADVPEGQDLDVIPAMPYPGTALRIVAIPPTLAQKMDAMDDEAYDALLSKVEAKTGFTVPAADVIAVLPEARTAVLV